MSTGIRVHVAGIGVQVQRNTVLENPGKASEIAGVAKGVIYASIHTLISRKVTAPVLFDEMPIGLRQRRTMAEGLARLEMLVANSSLSKQTGTPTLDIIAAVVAFNYLRFRFPDATWMPGHALAQCVSAKMACAGVV